MNPIDKKMHDFILSFDRFFLKIISERKKRDLLLTSYIFYYINDKRDLRLINKEKFQEILLSQVDQNAKELNTLISVLKEVVDDFFIKNKRYSDFIPTNKYIDNINEKIEKIKSMSDKGFLNYILIDENLISQIMENIKKVQEYDEINV